MSGFLNSPGWSAIIGVVGSATTGLIVMLARVLGKVSRIEDKMGEIAQDVSDIKSDTNIVRWSELARHGQRGRRRNVI